MRWMLGLLLLLTAFQTAAQEKRYGDVGHARPLDCRSIARGHGWNPYVHVIRQHCEISDARARQATARSLGRLQPSMKVLTVPAHGTDESRRYGIACMGGLAMLRLENGWQQALDAEHRYYTCRER